MKVIIIPNQNKDNGLKITAEIERKLKSFNIETYIDTDYSETLSSIPSENCPEDADLIVVVGGDGSVIDASGLATLLDIPLIGVNLGKVGYLSEVEPDELDLLGRLAIADYTVEERMLLSAEKIDCCGMIEEASRLAVNDVVISHDDYFGISDLKVENGRGDLVRYRADGVIIATPQGSTAYSFSAGGPIISHSLELITVTPVCPHSLFNRSVVYDRDECISVSNSGEEPLNISIDGRFFTKLNFGEVCRIKRSCQKLKIITFSQNNMFAALFGKIKNLEE